MKTFFRIFLIALTFGVFAVSLAEAAYAQEGVSLTTRSRAILRSGPGKNYASLGAVPARTTLPVVGRDAANQWLQVDFSNARGWLSVSLVTVKGDLNSVPVVEVPPVQPTFTPTPKPTNVPPVRVGREIRTPKGILTVSKVKTMSRYPENCFPPCNALVANPGFTLLLVYFKTTRTGSLDEIHKDISASKAWTQSYLVVEGGDPAVGFRPSTLVRQIGLKGRTTINDLFILYGVPVSARRFQLFWPDNAPVRVRR